MESRIPETSPPTATSPPLLIFNFETIRAFPTFRLSTALLIAGEGLTFSSVMPNRTAKDQPSFPAT